MWFRRNTSWGQDHLGNRFGTPFEASILRMHILFEVHDREHITSYSEFPGNFGLKLPENKSYNSWRVLYLRTSKKNYYLRWTLPRGMVRVRSLNA